MSQCSFHKQLTIAGACLMLTLAGSGALAYRSVSASPDAYTSASDETVVTGNLISKSTVKADKLVGEWQVDKGLAAYSSTRDLKAAGQKHTTDALGALVTDNLENVSMSATTLTFAKNGKVKVQTKKGSAEGTFKTSGSTITITLGTETYVLNAKVSGKKLQLLAPFTQCPKALQQIIGKYRTEGLYLGATYKKK